MSVLQDLWLFCTAPFSKYRWKCCRNRARTTYFILYTRLNDNIKFVLLCLKTALISQDTPWGTLEGTCGGSVVAVAGHSGTLSCPMNGTLAQDVLDLAATQNLVLSVSLSYLWSDGLHYSVGGGRHCQEGVCLLCRNILIGSICTDNINNVRTEDISHSVSGLCTIQNLWRAVCLPTNIANMWRTQKWWWVLNDVLHSWLNVQRKFHRQQIGATDFIKYRSTSRCSIRN